MSWQRRLLELAAAGGVLAGCTDDSSRVSFCGNASPDPCICNRMPANTPQCMAEAQCQANGWTWEFPDYGQPGPGSVWGTCVNPHPDARIPEPPVDDGLHPSG